MVLHAMMVKNAMSRPWAGWKRFRRKVGNIQARVLLNVFYFVVVAPFALVVKLSSDPLGLSPKTPKEWRPRHRDHPLRDCGS